MSERQEDGELPRTCRQAALRRRAQEVVAVLAFFMPRRRKRDARLLDLVLAAVAPLGPVIRRRRADDALVCLDERLEQRVAERTAAIAERNEALLESEARFRNLDAVERAYAQARRAGEIVRRIRGFLRKGDGEPQVLDLNELVREAVELIEPGSRAGGVTLAVDANEGPTTVRVQRIEIEQVILDLLRNATEAMAGCEEGKREVAIRVRREGRCAHLGVYDTGPGMDGVEAAHAFDPFYTSKPDGMGLGLSICRTFVERHGGRIRLDTEAGAGCAFHVTLPLFGRA